MTSPNLSPSLCCCGMRFTCLDPKNRIFLTTKTRFEELQIPLSYYKQKWQRVSTFTGFRGEKNHWRKKWNTQRHRTWRFSQQKIWSNGVLTCILSKESLTLQRFSFCFEPRSPGERWISAAEATDLLHGWSAEAIFWHGALLLALFVGRGGIYCKWDFHTKVQDEIFKKYCWWLKSCTTWDVRIKPCK